MLSSCLGYLTNTTVQELENDRFTSVFTFLQLIFWVENSSVTTQVIEGCPFLHFNF